MNIEKQHLKTILSILLKAYPKSYDDWKDAESLVGGDNSLIGHLVYLQDKGFIEGTFKFLGSPYPNQWNFDLNLIRINANGIDYLDSLNKEYDRLGKVAL